MSDRTHRNNFDLIRLYAAAQVALAHCASHLGVPLPIVLQWLDYTPGVPIFFVISGYLISASFARNRDLGTYFRNRCLRIFPGLWLCLAVTCLSLILLYRPDELPSVMDVVTWLVAQLTVGQFYTADFLRGYGVGTPNGSLWTIPVELQFYLLVPVLFLLFDWRRWSWRILVSAIIALICVNQVFFVFGAASDSMPAKLIGVTVLPYLYLFLLGMALHAWKDRVLPILAGKAWIWLVVYIVVTMLADLAGLQVTGNLLNPLSAIVLGLLTISAAHTLPELASRLLRGNDISYGLYIYHMVVVNALIAIGMQGEPAHLFVALAISVLLAALSWVLVEKRALTFKRRQQAPAATFSTR